jgi:multicomponent Na+:H+ antiporter subunit F
MDGFVIVASVLVALNAVAFVRVALGPSVYDRLLAAGAVGTNSIVLLAVLGFIYERPGMFVDLAITYALLNFIGAVAAAKYLERHPEPIDPLAEQLSGETP